MESLSLGIVWYVTFLLSVTLHEAAHAWVAMRGGDRTALRGGQVTLNPLPHVQREPFGMVVLPLLSLFLAGWPFGFASTPYDPLWARRYPRRAARMALAGPAGNLLLALAAGIGIRAGAAAGVFEPGFGSLSSLAVATRTGFPSSLAVILSVWFSLNLILAILNLIPIPPLDGFGTLPLLAGEGFLRRVDEWMRHPLVPWIGLLAAWRLFDVVFPPLFRASLGLLFP